MADSSDFQAQLLLLSAGYAAQLPEKLDRIEQEWTQLPRSEWDEVGVRTLHRMVHSLTGSGKTFGFASLSEVASRLEKALEQLVQTKTMPGDEARQRIHGLLSELHRALIENAGDNIQDAAQGRM